MSGCRFLVHELFERQYLDFLTEHPEASDALLTQFRKSRSDPASEGRLGLILNPRLEGKLYKLWVVGPRGYRYVYFHDPEHSVTLPIFLSQKPRADFNWDSAPFADVAEQIVADFDDGQWERFREIERL